jgi:gamma-glutamyltranspeptidase / glutathione hydrolase
LRSDGALATLSHTFAWVHGIKITPDGLEGVADPETDGMALSV